jgi:hypothetical protein
MPTLSDPKLTITVDTGEQATVTASVDVFFSEEEKQLIAFLPFINYLVTCKIWGADPVFDDGLFQLGNATIRDDQDDLTFSSVVSKEALDEDNDGGDDEIYAEFTCVPGDSPLDLKSATPVKSLEVTGSF